MGSFRVSLIYGQSISGEKRRFCKAKPTAYVYQPSKVVFVQQLEKACGVE